MTTITPDKFLSGIPAGLRDPLVASFETVVRNYREGRWEPSELNGGKLCEIVYTILRGYVDGKMPGKPNKPKNMVDACKGLENADQVFPRAVRIQIPRMLIALYEIRNNRGVGHAGGEVDPNRMDARVVLEICKWVLADLVRVFHNLDTTSASSVVELLVERTVPMIWDVDGNIRRVLDSGRSAGEQTLLLLYGHTGPARAEWLFECIEYSTLSNFKRDVLRPYHKKRLLDFQEPTGLVRLSPSGMTFVETKLPLELSN